MTAGINTTALLLQAGALIVEQKQADTAHLAESVGRNSERIKANSEETDLINDEMRDIQSDAMDMSEKAANTKGFARFFGVAKSRQKKAEKLNSDAEVKAGEAELENLETEEFRESTKEALDQMKELGTDVSSTKAFLDKAQKRQVVMKP